MLFDVTSGFLLAFCIGIVYASSLRMSHRLTAVRQCASASVLMSHVICRLPSRSELT